MLFIVIALTLTYLAGLYVLRVTGSAVPDLILDHIPTIDLSFIFI